MAVYTEVPPSDAAALLADLRLGRLENLLGISSGIENTNYFATTDQGEWVLTLFERMQPNELPYYLELMRHLARAGLPVPWPQEGHDHQLVHVLAGKPAAVVSRLRGTPVLQPLPSHCAQVGRFLGLMHRSGQAFLHQQQHGRGLAWWGQTVPEVLPYVSTSAQALLLSELDYQRTVAASAAGMALPRGHIHADLFRDNAMFGSPADGSQLCGVLDFYFAGIDVLLFDVAVCINDWCVDDDSGRIDPPRAQALIQAYRAEREWAHGEWRLLPALLRAAALRFWLSRLRDWHLPREASLLTPKDPAHFERVLKDRIDNPWLPDA
jgi:homoserine kinase type II